MAWPEGCCCSGALLVKAEKMEAEGVAAALGSNGSATAPPAEKNEFHIFSLFYGYTFTNLRRFLDWLAEE